MNHYPVHAPELVKISRQERLSLSAGDAQISIGQLLRLAGALVVTTPQDLALIDARRGVTLFRTMSVCIYISGFPDSH